MRAYVCDRCGACCRHMIVEADEIDVLRQPMIAEKCKGPAPTMKALAELGAVWLVAGGETRPCPFAIRRGCGVEAACSIYHTRPSACVLFQAGSRKCKEARALQGLPPLLLVSMKATDQARYRECIRRALDDEESWIW